MENYDLKIIKKHYGENFAHMCRRLFPSILETKGMLSEIILKAFQPNKLIFEDVKNYEADFFNFINEKYFPSLNQKEIKTELNVYELFNQAGYTLMPECLSEEEIQLYKKFYAPNEILCSFYQNRTSNHRVWFAVKNNVDQIKRENFTNPMREDEYGTSVLSIQIANNTSNLTIKNRYNHAVRNPDNTFNNNLDNIIPGLTYAFKKEFNIQKIQYNPFSLSNYHRACNGKYFRYSSNTNKIYFCSNNVILYNDEPFQLDSSKYLIVDSFILNLKTKKFEDTVVGTSLIDNKVKQIDVSCKDAFIDTFGEIKNIEISNDKKEKVKNIKITPVNGENIDLKLNNENQLIYLSNPNVKVIRNNFLFSNNSLKTLFLPNVEFIEHNFLYTNECLNLISVPKVEFIGDDFLKHNICLDFLSMPKLNICGSEFLKHNNIISGIWFPNLKYIGANFMYYNNGLTNIMLPSLQVAHSFMLFNNKSIKNFRFPNLKYTDENILYENENFLFSEFNASNKIITKQFDFDNLQEKIKKEYFENNQIEYEPLLFI